MTTNVIPQQRQAFMFTPDNYGFELPKLYKKDAADSNSPWVVKDVPVFRSGTFRDSMGDQHTWNEENMQTMVSNFDSLRAKMTLPNIPVRDGHRSFLSSGGTVVGWHTELKTAKLTSPHDDKEYTYLQATYDITEPDAAGKIQRGTWRSRSSEIGRYIDNDENELWPVYMGVAYVDFPAVEGLEGHSKEETGKLYVFMSERGLVVSSPITPAAPPVVPPVTTPPVTPHAAGTPVAPVVAPVTPPAATPVTPVAPATSTPPPAAPQQVVFTVEGKQTTDLAAVQAYVTRIETAQKETRDANRKAFVASLVQNNKLVAPQQQSTETFALSLDDAQYTAWSAMWADAAPNSLLQPHGVQNSIPTPTGTMSASDQDLADAEGIVKELQRSGLSQEVLEQAASYKKLVAAGRIKK